MPTPLDLRPLTSAIPPEDARRWEARYRSTPSLRTSLATRNGGLGVRTMLASSAGVVLGLVLLTTPSPVAVGVVVALASGLVLATAIVLTMARSRPWERWARLDGFARANGMVFSPGDPVPAAYTGLVFGQGWDRSVEEHLMAPAGIPFFDMGVLRWLEGDPRSPTVRRWGFIALRLQRRLPHLVLDARSNNAAGVSDLPAGFDRSQILHLEGDFDRYFTLYCPSGYEVDALYVFTPDLMALLIDEAGAWNVEIVDDWMFLTRPIGFDLTRPATVARAFRTLDLVGAKALRQTSRYVDDRMGDPSAGAVAPQGQRLRRGFPLAAVVLIGVIGLTCVLPLIFPR